MVTIQKAIRWWEDDLTSEERSELIPESWSEIGENNPEGIAKRHRRLIKAYQEYHKAKQKEARHSSQA